MKLLETLCRTPGVAGREDRVRAFIRKEAADLFDDFHEDALGTLTGIRKPRPKGGKKARKKPTRVMIAAHMDQIGFMVRHIDDKGFLRIQNVGGFDTRNLFARMVTVCTRDGDLPGVLNAGGKPVHIASAEDRKKVPEIEDLVVDLGLPVDEVRERVRVGDMVVIRAAFTEVGNTVVGQAMDNRVACWIAIRAMSKLKHHNCEIHCCFTVQEEVGCRGAGPAAARIQPDVGIALDTTLCCDTPGVPGELGITAQGAGAGLMVMDSSAISDADLLERFERVAKKRTIAAQRTILPRGGTDASTIQRAANGCRTMTLVCPTRYIHTITEMVHRDDLHACRDLLAAVLEDL